MEYCVYEQLISIGRYGMELNQSSTLLGRVREVIRYKHYSIRTERCYVEWVRRFVAFHGRRHPREMGADEVRSFLGHLAADLQVAASTHQQALSALLFLYREVLGVDLPWLIDLDRPKKPKRTPVVLSRGEVERLLAVMDGTHALMARLLYGTGMRLMECVRLRVKDVDFERSAAPLAEQLRPQTPDEVIGQQHLLGPGKPLRLAFASGQPHSMILWGPPGVGKTTLARMMATQFQCEFIALSAVFSGIKEVREAVAQAEMWRRRAADHPVRR
jgi:hypothetical protein